MRQMNINKGNHEVKSHYKMYKAGKRWVVAGMATVSLLGGLLMLSADASADSVDAVVPASESSVTAEVSAPTDSVVLDSASASVAPASSVSAEVSASSASSVAPVSVSTSVSVVSADASLSASQSLASSVVVPADAVKVQDDVDADGNARKAYALGTSTDANQDVQTPASANTNVSTYNATPSSADWTITKPGSLAASEHVATSNAVAKSQFTYIGSGSDGNTNVNPNFKQTGDITGDVTWNNSYKASTVSNATDLQSVVSVANSVADSVVSSLLPGKENSIDWKAITPQISNEGGILAYGSKLKTTNEFEIRGGYVLLPILADGTTGSKSNLYTSGQGVSNGMYGGGQAVGVIMTTAEPTDMGTLKMGPKLATLNLSDGIEGVPNAVIAGRDLYIARQGDIDPLLVHVRQTNANGALYADNSTANTINGVNGSKNIEGNAVTKNVNDQTGYAYAKEAYDGNGNKISVSSTASNATYVGSDSDKYTAIQNYLSKGVYFDYLWVPQKNADGTLKMTTINGEQYVNATLTYTEYANADAIAVNATAATKAKYLLSTVTSNVIVQQEMSIGLFAGNGGNGQSFFGGISYFRGTNVTDDVQVNYQFKKDPTSLVQTNTVTALAGETVQINGGKDTVAATDGHYVSNYDAPEIKGFKVDSSSKLSAIAGTDKTLTVIYTADQDVFDAQVTTAQSAKNSIDASITTAQDALKKAKTDQDKSDINEAITQLQGMSDKVQGIINQLKKDTDATKISALDTVNAVTSTLTALEKTAASATAMADDATNLTNAVTSFSDANTTDKDEDIAHTRAELEGQTASNSVTDKMGTKVQEAKKALDAAIADKTSTTADIVYKRSVLLADMATDEQASNDDVAVAAATNRLNDLVDGGMDKASATDLDDARAALATAVANVVNKNVLDDTDVQKAQTNYANDLATGKDTTDSLKALQDAVANANTALQEVETNAKNDAVPSNLLDQINSEASSSLAAIVDKTHDIGADSTYTKSQLVDQMNSLSSALSGFSAARTEKSLAASSVLTSLGTASLAGDLSDAVSALRSTLSDSAATKTEIENRTAVVNADSLLSSLANPDMKTTSMSSYVSSIASYVSSMASASNVTSSALSTATSALKSVADTPVSSVVEDNTAVKSAESAFASDLIAGKDITSASSALSVAVSTANTELTAAKKSAASYAIPSNIADQTEGNSALNSELAKVQSMGAASTYTKIALDSEMAILSDSLSHFTSILNTAKTSAASTAKTTGNDIVNSMASVLKSVAANSDATLSMVASASTALKLATSTVVDSDIADDVAVKNAETDYASALNSGAATSDALASVSLALSVATSAATSVLSSMKSAASVAVVDSNLTDQEDASMESIVTKLNSLGAKSNGVKVADMSSALSAYNSAVASYKTVLSDAKSVASVTASKTTGNDIVNSMASILTSVAANSAATSSMVASASTALKLATSTVVDSDITDDAAVKSAETAYVSALKSGAKTPDELATVNKTLSAATSAATSTLNSMKSAAKVAVIDSNLTDQEDASMAAVVSDLNSLGAKSNGVKATDMSSALSAYDSAVKSYKAVLSDAKSAASVTASKATGNDIVNSMASILTSVAANSAATSSMVASASTALKLATSTSVAANVADDDVVMSAESAYVSALNSGAVTSDALSSVATALDSAKSAAATALATAKSNATTEEPANLTDQIADLPADDRQKLTDTIADLATKVGDDATTLKQIQHDQDIIDGILSGLKTKLNDAKTGAKGDVTAWDKVSSLYADQTDETSAIQKDIDTLNGLTADKTATKKQIDDARKQLQDDIDVVKGVRNDAVTDGKNTADANKDNGDAEVQKTVVKLNNALDNGTASDIKTAIENVKTAVDTVVVPNISDSDDVADAKKAVNDALNADKLDKTAVQNAVDNFNTAVAKAQKDLADTKDGAANDEKSWTADAPKYADQTTTSIQDDIKKLNELTSDKTATKKTIDAARKQLQDDIKTVADVRDAAVKTADDANKAVVNGDNDDVKNHQAAVDNAVKTGTASDIANAVAKLQTADATVVPTNVSDDADVTAAKTAVDDALKNDGDVAKAKATYDNAVDQAKTKLADAKQDANDDTSAWDKAASLYTDQDTDDIQNDVKKLNDLVADKNATKSDIDDAREQLRKDIAVVTGARDGAVDDGNDTVDANADNDDAEVKTTVDTLKDAIANGTKKAIETAINKVKTAVDTIVAANISDDADVNTAKKAVNDILNADGLDTDKLTKATDKLTTAVADAKKALQTTKDGASDDESSWNDDTPKYADQDMTAIQNDIDHLNELTADKTATKTAIDDARKQLQDDIKAVDDVRQKAVDGADDAVVAVKNGDNDDVQNRVAAVKDAEKTGTATDVAKAVAKLQTADATVVPTNVSDDVDVTAAKKAVDDALNNDGDVDTAKTTYDNAVATAQATLKRAVADANAVKVPANLQDQVEMAKKNKLGDVNQQVTDLQNAASQDDTTATTLRSGMSDIQARLDDMTAKLNTTRDAAQKLVDQTADATDTNVVAARKQVTNLLANNDTTTMTDLQNAMNVLTATSKPADANVVKTPAAPVKSGQVSTTVADGDMAFAIVTDANGKQTVVQMSKDANGTATATCQALRMPKL